MVFWVTRTLFQEIGAHILFVFLFVSGFMLLTGASIAGVIRATSESVHHHDAAGQALHGRVRARQAAAGARHAPEPADTEPVVRATHVEAPSIEIEEEWDDEVPEVVEGQAIDTEDGEGDDEFIVKAAEPPKPEDLTPQGNLRSNVTEADDYTYTVPPAPST